MLTIIFSVGDDCAIGPIGVCDQSLPRMSALSSPLCGDETSSAGLVPDTLGADVMGSGGGDFAAHSRFLQFLQQVRSQGSSVIAAGANTHPTGTERRNGNNVPRFGPACARLPPVGAGPARAGGYGI